MVTASPKQVHILRCYELVAGNRRCNAEIGSSSKPMRAVRTIKNVRDIRSKDGVTSSFCKRCNVATEFEPEKE